MLLHAQTRPPVQAGPLLRTQPSAACPGGTPPRDQPVTRIRDRRAVLPKEVAIPEGFTTPVQANRTTLSVTRMAQYGEVCKAQSCCPRDTGRGVPACRACAPGRRLITPGGRADYAHPAGRVVSHRPACVALLNPKDSLSSGHCASCVGSEIRWRALCRAIRDGARMGWRPRLPSRCEWGRPLVREPVM